jgi:hypothetical protein
LSRERLFEAIGKNKVAKVDGLKNFEGELAVLSAVLNFEGKVLN